MRCPFCSAEDTKVVDSRLSGEGEAVRRRRACIACGQRFTTYEQAELSYPKVIKSDSSREDFSEVKLRAGIGKALEKRPVSVEAIDAAVDQIKLLLHHTEAREVASVRLGEWVMDALRELDRVAYIRFASVYRSFEDADAFRREVERLEQEYPAVSSDRSANDRG